MHLFHRGTEQQEDRVLASWTEEDRRKYLELIEKFKVQFEKEVKAYDKRK